MVAPPKPPDEPAHDVLAAEEFGVPAPDPRLHREDPHDVLAAEEFGVPAPDPRLHREDPHDVLAAEEFGVPAPDPALHHGLVELPGDPTGIAEPHDVLAAEEFALPAPRDGAQRHDPAPRAQPSRGAIVAAGAVAWLVLRRRARRHRAS